jgi:hypothetical protein
VYVVTIIIDISNRTYPEYLLVEMLGVSRRDRARKMLSRYLPKNLFAVDHKVVGQEINVKLTYPDDIRISGYVDMDDIQPLNIGDNIHMRVDPCININDISTFVTYDPL